MPISQQILLSRSQKVDVSVSLHLNGRRSTSDMYIDNSGSILRSVLRCLLQNIRSKMNIMVIQISIKPMITLGSIWCVYL